MIRKDEIEKKLREKGVKPTPQRVQIAELFLSAPCHMSAEQILTSLLKAGERISKATVYNTLNLFSRKGIIREVAVDPSRLMYDSTTHFHHHFYNVDTGQLTDIDAEDLEILGLPPLPEGTETQSVELIVRLRNKR